MAKKNEQNSEIGYFLDAELHTRFHQWWESHSEESEDKRVTSFIQAFPNDPLVHEGIGAESEKSLIPLLDHIRSLINQEKERERVKSDLMYLCREYLGYNDLNDELHGRGIREVDRAIEAGIKDILILWPRGHLKTSVFSIGRTIRGILRNPNCRKSIMSYGYSKAMEIVAEIKAHLANPRLIALFPEILWENPQKEAPFWREDRFTVNRSKVTSGFTLKVNGIMQGYTGEHNDEMIFDDPHDMENTQTLEWILKVIERFKNCASVLDPDGVRIVVGTIWANEDLYNWCKEHGFHVIRRTATENSRGEECDVDEPDAHVVFPEKFNLEILKKKKAEQGRAFYAKQYNLMPLAEEDIRFKEEDIKTYEGKEPPLRRIYMLVDPALSKEKAHDNTALVIVGYPKDDKLPLYVMKSTGMRKKTQGVIDVILNEFVGYSRICPDVYVGIEQAALQYILIEWLQKEMQRRKIFFAPHELKHRNRPKPERISRLEPYFNQGGIVLHKTRCERLRQQLINYGASRFDDEIDALAYIAFVMEDQVPVDVIIPTENRHKDDPYSLEAMVEQMEVAGDSWRDF